MRLLFNKWYGGISNDPNAGQLGSIYNCEGLDVYSSSKFVRLSKGYQMPEFQNSRTNGFVVASLIESNVNYLELSRDGYIGGYSNSDTGLGYVVKSTLGDGCNLGKITNELGNTYGFAIHSNYFSKWSYNSSQLDLGTYASSTTGLNTDPSFLLGTGWTIGTNWSISGGKATHTVGSTDVLIRTLTPVNGTKYRVQFKGFVTAGSCEVKIGGSSMGTLSTSTNNITQVGFRTATSTSEPLEFVPTSDFDGWIDECYIQEFLITSTSKNFNTNCPYSIYANRIYIGNSNKVTVVDMTTGTPIISDTLVIDYDYKIIGLTRISDQFFIYASNGSNGRQYIWNGIDTAPTRVITWVDKPIINVANFANIDYVITGTQTRQQLSIVNGYQLQPIIITDDYGNNWDRIFLSPNNTNSVETISNKLLIGGIGGIYSFGKKTPGLPNALVKEYIFNGSELTNISYSESVGYSIFAYFSGTINNGSQVGITGNYKIQIYLPEGNNNEVFGTIGTGFTGFLETQPIFGETYSNRKTLNKYTIGAKLYDSTQINVYIKETDSENYANLYFPGANLGIAIGDTYTHNSKTYTVQEITNSSLAGGYILHCTYTGNKLIGIISGTFTRTFGTGPASIYVDKVRYGYKLHQKFTDKKPRLSSPIFGEFNETMFAIELISFDEKKTPKLYDFNIYYNDNTNDQ